MVEVEEPRHRQTHLPLAAWASPIIPVAAVLLMIGWAKVYPGDASGVRLAFVLVGLACAVGFLSGYIGCFGVRANGVWATLPAAVLGLILNTGVGVLALLLWFLSYMMVAAG